MRVLLVLALIPFLAACSIFSSSEPSATLVDTQPTETAAGTTDSTGAPASGTNTAPASVTPTPVAATPTPAATPPVAAKTPVPTPAPAAPAPSASSTGADISGKWVGSWVGTGLFNSPRQENLTLELAQKGDAGYGRLVIDNAVAAESVPWEVRQQGLGGIRVFATIDGSKVRLTHESDDRVFMADLTVNGDQMVGQVKGRKVRLLLARQGGSTNAPAREVPPQAAQVMPPTIVASAPAPQQPAVAMAPAPQAQEPDKPKAEEVMQRPKNEEYVAAPELKTVYFDFDKSNLRQDAVDRMSSNVTWLKENADTFVLIEGNADERGTAEYNLALGDRRAKSAMDYLEANGIAKDRMATVSYGKEHPACTDATEECRYQNRRADFRVKSR